MVYDSMFVQINDKDKALTRAIRRRIMKLCNVHLTKLNKFAEGNTLKLSGIQDKEDLVGIVSAFKQASFM